MKDPDELLILQIKTGDKNSFEVVFRKYYQDLCQYSFRFVTDSHFAEEIVQDFFFKFWLKRESLDVSSSLRSYLFRAVQNHSLNHIEHQKINKKYADYIGFQTQGNGSHFTDFMIEKELEQQIQKAIVALPPRRREIFELSRFEGLKYQEIADRLKINIKTVESQMVKALEQLRSDLSEYLPSIIVLFIINILTK
ncbi:MAG: RNA polymerase sigma-70 factor [Bacteroidales bacterium]